MRALNVAATGLAGEKVIYLVLGAVVHCHLKTMVTHVQRQVLAHHRQAD